MESTQTYSFNIPKLKRQATKDNLLEIDPKSRDAKELLSNVTRSYLDPNYCGPWQIQAIHSVRNTDLEQDYRNKRSELKEEGRHSRELTDQIAFYAIRDPSYVPRIAKNGLTTNNLPFNIIGDHHSGVYLSKHADVSLQMLETISNQLTTAIVVFNVLMGKCKPVNERLMPGVEPTPNYDCHVGLQPAQLSDIHVVQMQRSQIYVYEYNDEGMPAPRPRHCLPYAVITYSRKADTFTPGSTLRSVYIYDPSKGPPPSKKSDEKNDWNKGPRHPKAAPSNVDVPNRMLPSNQPLPDTPMRPLLDPTIRSLLGPSLSNRDQMLPNVFPMDSEGVTNEQCSRMLASLFLGYGSQGPLSDIAQKLMLQRSSGSDPQMKFPLDQNSLPFAMNNPNFFLENSGQFMSQLDKKTDLGTFQNMWGSQNPMQGFSNEPPFDQMYPPTHHRHLMQNEIDPQCLGDQHPWKTNSSNNKGPSDVNCKGHVASSKEWAASGSEYFENQDWKYSYLNNCDNKTYSSSTTTTTTTTTSTTTTSSTCDTGSANDNENGCNSSDKTKNPIPFALNKKKNTNSSSESKVCEKNPTNSSTETKVCEKRSTANDLSEKTVLDLLDRLPTVKKDQPFYDPDSSRKSVMKNLVRAATYVPKSQSELELTKKSSSKMSESEISSKKTSGKISESDISSKKISSKISESDISSKKTSGKITESDISSKKISSKMSESELNKKTSGKSCESELIKRLSSKPFDSVGVGAKTMVKTNKTLAESDSSFSGHAKGAEGAMQDLMTQLLDWQSNETPELLSTIKKSLTLKIKNKKSEDSIKKSGLNKLTLADLRKFRDFVQSKLKASKEVKNSCGSSLGTIMRVTPEIKSTTPPGKSGLKTTILLPTVIDYSDESTSQTKALSKLLSTVESSLEAREILALSSNDSSSSSKVESSEVTEFHKNYNTFLQGLRKRKIKDGGCRKLVAGREQGGGVFSNALPPAPATEATMMSIDDVMNTKLINELLLFDPENSDSSSASEADSLYVPPSERKRKKGSSAAPRGGGGGGGGALLKKNAPFDMNGYRRRRKKQKMKRKASSELDELSLVSTTNLFGGQAAAAAAAAAVFGDNVPLTDLNKKVDSEGFPIFNYIPEEDKYVFSDELPVKPSVPTLKLLGYDNWRTAMYSVNFQPVVALNDCVKEITNHLKREGTSNVMNWNGSHQELMNALNIPEKAAPNKELFSKPYSPPASHTTDRATSKPTDKATSKPTDKATFKPTDKATFKPTDKATFKPTDKATFKPTDKTESTASSTSSSNSSSSKLMKTSSKTPAATAAAAKSESEEFGSTIDIASLKNDAKRKFTNKSEKTKKAAVKTSAEDCLKKKIKMAKEKFSQRNAIKDNKKVDQNKKETTPTTTSPKLEKEKKPSTSSATSAASVASTKVTSSTTSVSSSSSSSSSSAAVQNKGSASVTAKTATTTTTTSTASSAAPKSIMKTSRTEPAVKTPAKAPSSFPATDQSLKVDLLLDSIIDPSPTVIVSEPKKPKSVISFETYKEKRLKPKSPPREKGNVFDSFQDIFSAEKDPPIFETANSEKPLFETAKDIELPSPVGSIGPMGSRDPRLGASQKEPPLLKAPLPLPKLPLPLPKVALPLPKVIPPLMSINTRMPMGVSPMLPVNAPPPPPLPPLLMPSLPKPASILKNPDLKCATTPALTLTPQSPKIIPQIPKVIPPSSKTSPSVRDHPKIFPKNKPLSKKPSSLPKTIPTSVTVSLKDPREQAGLVDPRLVKKPAPPHPPPPPPSRDVHPLKEESAHDPSLPRDPRLLRLNRDLSNATNEASKAGKAGLLQETELYNPIKIKSEGIEDVSTRFSKDIMGSSKTVINHKPWNLCVIQTSVDKPKATYDPRHVAGISANKDLTPSTPKLSLEQKADSPKDNLPDYAKFSKEINKTFKPSTPSVSLEKGELFSPVSPERSEEPTKVKPSPEQTAANDNQTWGFYREMSLRKSASDAADSAAENNSKLSSSKQKANKVNNSERNGNMQAFSPGHCMNADDSDYSDSNEDLSKPLYIDESASGTPDVDHRLSPIKEALRALSDYDDDDDDSCDGTSWKLPFSSKSGANVNKTSPPPPPPQQKLDEKDKSLFQSLSKDLGLTSQTGTKDSTTSNPETLFSAYKSEEPSSNSSQLWMKNISMLSQAKAVSSLNLSDKVMDILRKVVKGSQDSDSPSVQSCNISNDGQKKDGEVNKEKICGESSSNIVKGDGKKDEDNKDLKKATADVEDLGEAYSPANPTTEDISDDNGEYMSGQAIPVLKPANERTRKRSASTSRSESPTAFPSLKLYPPPNWLPQSPFIMPPDPLKPIDWTVPPPTSQLATSLHSQQLLWSPTYSMSQSLLGKNLPFPVGFPSPDFSAANSLMNQPINPLMIPKQTDLADWFADKINLPKPVNISTPSTSSSASTSSSPSSSNNVNKNPTEKDSDSVSVSKSPDSSQDIKPSASISSENLEINRSSCYSPTDKTLELSSLSCLEHSDSSKDGLNDKTDGAKMKKSSSTELFVPLVGSETSNKNSKSETSTATPQNSSKKEANSTTGKDCDKEKDASKRRNSSSKKGSDRRSSSRDVDSSSDNVTMEDINNEVSKLLSYMGSQKRHSSSSSSSSSSSRDRSKSSSSSSSSSKSKDKDTKGDKHDDSIPKSVQISTINSRKLKEASLPESNRKILKELAKQFSKHEHKSDLQALLESVKKIKKELALQPSESSKDSSKKSSSDKDKKSGRDEKRKEQPLKSGSKRPASSDTSSSSGSSRSKYHKSSSDKKGRESLWKPVKGIAEEGKSRSRGAAPIVINYKQKGSEKTEDSRKSGGSSESNGRKSSSSKEKRGSSEGDKKKSNNNNDDDKEGEKKKKKKEEQDNDSELEEGELPDDDDDDDNHNNNSHGSEMDRMESMRKSERRWSDKRDHSDGDRFYESMMPPGRPPRDAPWDMENNMDDYRRVHMDEYPRDQSEAYSRDCYPRQRGEPFPHPRLDNCPFPLAEGYPRSPMDDYPPEHVDIPRNQMDNYPHGRPGDNRRGGGSKNYHGGRGHYPHDGPYSRMPEDMESGGYYSDDHKMFPRGKSDNFPRGGKAKKFPTKRARRRAFKKKGPSQEPDDYRQDNDDGFLYEKSDQYFYDEGFPLNQSENFFPGNRGDGGGGGGGRGRGGRGGGGGFGPNPGELFNCDNDNMDGNYGPFGPWPCGDMDGPMQRFPKHSKSVFDRLSIKDPKSELASRLFRGKHPFPGDGPPPVEDSSIPFPNNKKKKLKTESEELSYEELLEQTARQLKEPTEEEEEKKGSSFETIDEYVQMFVEQGCTEYNIIKKVLGVSLDTRFDTMSKTRRKKIRKKIQSQLQVLKQAPSINNNNNNNNNNEIPSLFSQMAKGCPPSTTTTTTTTTEPVAFNLDSIPGYTSLKFMSDPIDLWPHKSRKHPMGDDDGPNSQSSPDMLDDSDDDDGAAEVPEDSNIKDPEVKQAVLKIRANMRSAAKKNGIGIPHQKIPLSLLLAEEKDSLFSSEGCFLILMRKIRTKSVERLVTLREVLDHINYEMQQAHKNNDAPKFQTLQATKINLHERRKCVLESFTGIVTQRRLRLINKVCKMYQACLDYMNANTDDVIKGVDKEFVVKSLKAIRGHKGTVKNLLDNKDCSAAPPPPSSIPPLLPNSELPKGMTNSSENYRKDSSMSGHPASLRFPLSNCHS